MGEQKQRQMRRAEYERLLKEHPTEIRKAINDLTKHLVDDGRLIEAGWLALRIQVIPDNASEIQLREMRMAFFSGAQHLLGSLVTFLEEGVEPTDADMDRMISIAKELEHFIEEFKLRAFKAEGSA